MTADGGGEAPRVSCPCHAPGTRHRLWDTVRTSVRSVPALGPTWMGGVGEGRV